MGTRHRFRLLLVVVLPLLLGASVTHGRDGLAVLFATVVSSALAAWFFIARPAQREIERLQGVRQQLSESHSASVDDLKRERDLLGSILETMQDGVLLLDAEDRVVLVNPTLRAALLLPADVVGMPLTRALSRSELGKLVELVSQTRTRREPLAEELVVSGLKPRRLAVRANPMRAPVGGLLLVFFDVTEIRRLETVRRDFVANVSHELRTPIASICSATETLLGGALGDPPAATRFVQMIDRNSERLRHLVEDLLDLSRIESQDYKLEREAIEVGAMVERSLSLLQQKAQRGRVRTDNEIPSNLPFVRADQRALEQVLTNLIDNGIKYCPPGSRVVVKARADGDSLLRLTVEDSGPGIPERDLPRIFERFYRVDPGRSRDMGGTGLGLSIVKHLVEAMGGEVGVESRVGVGSSFWFTLPRA
jgi:two-component system, OmpR family, phosphate regulon sensor histidine kinase PhoR